MKCRTALVFQMVATLVHLHAFLSQLIQSKYKMTKANPGLEYKITRLHTSVQEAGKDENETHLTNETTNTTTTVTMGRRTKGPGWDFIRPMVLNWSLLNNLPGPVTVPV